MFDAWTGKIPWKRKWQPTPVFLLGKFSGQRSLVGSKSMGLQGSDTTEQLILTRLWFYIINNINSVGPVCWKGLKDLTPQFVCLLLVSKYHLLIKEILGFTEKVIDSMDGIGIIQNDPEWFCIARKHGHVQKRRKEKRDEGISKEHRSLSEYHKCIVAQWCLTLCDSMDFQMGSPGKNTGVSCHTLL